MCGIAGVYSLRPIEPFRSDVERIVESQHRRGPDFRAVEMIRGRRAGALLGHNRLSIIDLSPTGNQPMWDVDRQLCVVFNGEIYNYVELRAELAALGHHFASTSDTEVLLESFKQWGTEAFGRFNGMFAFGLLDVRGERLCLVRDRFGVKPLYYAAGADTVHFASTPRAIGKLLRLAPDPAYASCGVRYSLHEHADAAPYLGMKAIPPGHWMEIRPAGSAELALSARCYYDLSERVAVRIDALAAMPTDCAVAQVAETLNDAVKLRLRADVPVAVSLSGGLDSSTVAALAAQYPHERLHGFTFGHPDQRDSEGPVAAQLGRMADIDITYIWPNVEQICRAYEETLQAQAGPFAGGSIVAQYMVFQAARAAGFKVLLGGQGGDEAFMGYRKFQVFHFRRLMAQRRYPAAITFAMSLLPMVFAERSRWAESWNARSRYLKRTGMTTVLRLPDDELAIGYSPSEPLRDRQIRDVTLASLPTLLRYEDSNSMGNSIESRLPFLDYRMMEIGVALPEAMKLRGGHGKWVLRRAMADKIPEAIRTARYKKGFDVQQGRWIDNGLGDRIRTMLRQRSDQIAAWLMPGLKLDEVFSNEQLKSRPAAFTEATTLLWLADATDGAAP
jgi:asparagine synthase (glutamine-hydrolysing)